MRKTERKKFERCRRKFFDRVSSLRRPLDAAPGSEVWPRKRSASEFRNPMPMIAFLLHLFRCTLLRAFSLSLSLSFHSLSLSFLSLSCVLTCAQVCLKIKGCIIFSKLTFSMFLFSCPLTLSRSYIQTNGA